MADVDAYVMFENDDQEDSIFFDATAVAVTAGGAEIIRQVPEMVREEP